MATKRTTEISFDFQVVIQEQSAVRTAEKNKIGPQTLDHLIHILRPN